MFERSVTSTGFPLNHKCKVFLGQLLSAAFCDYGILQLSLE